MSDTSKNHNLLETVGVIDIGTNSLRLEVAEVYEDASVRVLERARLPVRLGQDTFVDNQLSRRTMNAAISILRGFKKILDTYQVTHVRTVATSAVREARNADAFIDRVFMSIGLDVEIIETTEEIRLTVAAVRNSLGSKSMGRGYSLVAEVGGGSAQMALLHHGETISSGSYALGSIRLQEALDTAGERPDLVADMIRHQIGSVITAIDSSLPIHKVRSFYAVGGDARFASEQIGEPHLNEHVKKFPAGKFDELVSRIEHFSPEDLARKYKMPFAEAETLVPALLVYQALLHATAAKHIVVSDVSMRDGLLHDLAREATGQMEPEESSSAVRSAKMLMQKCHCDEQHADHVAHLALRLFDELGPEHGLPPRYRMLLHVSALVHEVGGFIHGRAHHKHSYYIISNSEIFGLRANEKQIVANVARYHRRSVPKQSHLPYMTLPREERVIVSKLAALLRVADALERGHNQQVRDFRLERREDEIVLHLQGVTDLALERRALAKKADLFEDIFGLKLRIEEV